MIIAIIILSWLLLNALIILLAEYIDRWGKIDKDILAVFAVVIISPPMFFSLGKIVRKIKKWRKSC